VETPVEKPGREASNKEQAELAKKEGREFTPRPTPTPKGKPGWCWELAMPQIERVLADPGKCHPGYDPKVGCEVAGLVWFQGYSDMKNPAYGELPAQMIRDFRVKVKTPNSAFARCRSFAAPWACPRLQELSIFQQTIHETNSTSPHPPPLLLAALCLASAHSLVAQSFYSGPSFFSQRPDETKSLTTIDRFGPVGMAIDLIHPVFTMRIKSIEEGSPAAATGKLKAGQIIESINGAALKEIDPRIQLGNLITAAEAADGVLKFSIKGEAEPVVVKIPVLGAYSPAWPLDCPKSDKIVRNLADYIASPKGDKGHRRHRHAFPAFHRRGQGHRRRRRVGAQHEAAHLSVVSRLQRHPAVRILPAHRRPEPCCPRSRMVDNAVATQYNDAWAGRGIRPP
jgi:hypothetical protein